ncbi:hypothetical protein NMY22_g12268 [Coprinellus aureogranulatus]|nr:hypothetical protein NMY22_g12268 [Coprinellus aureogranulatus]
MLNREVQRAGFVEAREAGAHWDAMASQTAALQDYKKKNDMLERKVAKLKKKVQSLHSDAKLKQGEMEAIREENGYFHDRLCYFKGRLTDELRLQAIEFNLRG